MFTSTDTTAGFVIGKITQISVNQQGADKLEITRQTLQEAMYLVSLVLDQTYRLGYVRISISKHIPQTIFSAESARAIRTWQLADAYINTPVPGENPYFKFTPRLVPQPWLIDVFEACCPEDKFVLVNKTIEAWINLAPDERTKFILRLFKQREGFLTPACENIINNLVINHEARRILTAPAIYI